jgi:hypothetical protein
MPSRSTCSEHLAAAAVLLRLLILYDAWMDGTLEELH